MCWCDVMRHVRTGKYLESFRFFVVPSLIRSLERAEERGVQCQIFIRPTDTLPAGWSRIEFIFRNLVVKLSWKVSDREHGFIIRIGCSLKISQIRKFFYEENC